MNWVRPATYSTPPPLPLNQLTLNLPSSTLIYPPIGSDGWGAIRSGSSLLPLNQLTLNLHRPTPPSPTFTHSPLIYPPIGSDGWGAIRSGSSLLPLNQLALNLPSPTLIFPPIGPHGWGAIRSGSSSFENRPRRRQTHIPRPAPKIPHQQRTFGHRGNEARYR